MKSTLFKLSSLLLLCNISFANDIYVNQVGDDLVLNITQDGKDNTFNFCATSAVDTNCVNANGNHNGWAEGYSTDNSTVNSSTTGDDNEVYMSHGGGTNNGNSRESNLSITGDTNVVENFLVNPSSGGNWGGHKKSNITITGDGNLVKHNNDSYGEGVGNISVSGDDNDVVLYQRAMDSTANINVTNAGGPVSATVRQLGSSYQDTSGYSTSVTQYCTNPSGCSVSVTQQ